MSISSPRRSSRARGRGRRYSPLRCVVEALLRFAYRGRWPAKLWALSPTARRVELLEQDLALLPAGSPPLKVAFASDLHFGPTTASVTMDRALEHLQRHQPDLLILGGDYVFLDASPPLLSELTAWVSAVPAALKLAVMGNHDLWTDDGAIARALAEGGARLLVNEAVRLRPPHQEVTIVGLDDPLTGSLDSELAFAGALPRGTTIAVCHSPDALGALQGRGAALLLCGHTHGGQVALPGGRPVYVPGEVGWRYPHGLHQLGDLHLFVSRGLGGVELPLRVNAPPDVAIFTLGPASPMFHAGP